MIDLKDIYRYAPFIYQCNRCGQQFPIWMVSDKDWKRGVKAMGPGFGPAKKICKPCFEEFNLNPKYLTLDEYMEMQVKELQAATTLLDPAWKIPPEGVAYKRETIAALWDIPPQYTEEEREEFIAKAGWPRGPFASCREPQK